MKVKRNFMLLNRQNEKGEITHTPPISVPVDEAYRRKIKRIVGDMKRISIDPPESFETRSLYAFNSPCNMCDYLRLCYDGDTSGLVVSFERKTSGKIFLSPSGLITYDTCPRQWAFSYLGYQREKTPAAIEFGNAINDSIDLYIVDGINPLETFREIWESIDQTKLEYTKKQPHKTLLKIGEALMKNFPEFYDRYVDSLGVYDIEVEKKLKIPLSSTVILSLRPDAIFYCDGEQGEEIVVTDFKTGDPSKYNERWIRRSDQLSLYQYAVEADIERQARRAQGAGALSI